MEDYGFENPVMSVRNPDTGAPIVTRVITSFSPSYYTNSYYHPYISGNDAYMSGITSDQTLNNYGFPSTTTSFMMKISPSAIDIPITYFYAI